MKKDCKKCLHLNVCKFHQEMLNVSIQPLFEAHPIMFNSLVYTFEVELPCIFYKNDKNDKKTNAGKN